MLPGIARPCLNPTIDLHFPSPLSKQKIVDCKSLQSGWGRHPEIPLRCAKSSLKIGKSKARRKTKSKMPRLGRRPPQRKPLLKPLKKPPCQEKNFSLSKSKRERLIPLFSARFFMLSIQMKDKCFPKCVQPLIYYGMCKAYQDTEH